MMVGAFTKDSGWAGTLSLGLGTGATRWSFMGRAMHKACDQRRSGQRSYESGSVVSLHRLFLLAQTGITFHLLYSQSGKAFNRLWKLLVR